MLHLVQPMSKEPALIVTLSVWLIPCSKRIHDKNTIALNSRKVVVIFITPATILDHEEIIIYTIVIAAVNIACIAGILRYIILWTGFLPL